MNLTARERLLMSLTSKQVEDIMDKMNTPTIQIPLIDYPPLEIDVIRLAKLSHLILDMNDLLDLHMTLQQRDQQVINENK